MGDWIADGKEKPAQAELIRQLELVVSRTTQEWDMTPSEVAGCLDAVKFDIWIKSMRADEEE